VHAAIIPCSGPVSGSLNKRKCPGCYFVSLTCCWSSRRGWGGVAGWGRGQDISVPTGCGCTDVRTSSACWCHLAVSSVARKFAKLWHRAACRPTALQFIRLKRNYGPNRSRLDAGGTWLCRVDLLLKVQVTFHCYWQMTQFMDRIPVNEARRFGFLWGWQHTRCRHKDMD